MGSRLAGASPPPAVSVLPPDRSQDSLPSREVMNARMGAFFPSPESQRFFLQSWFLWVPARWEGVGSWYLGCNPMSDHAAAQLYPPRG